MMKRSFPNQWHPGKLVVFLLFGLLLGSSANAKQIAVGDWMIDIHGYGDSEYTWMSEMPMRMPLLIRAPDHPMGMPVGMHIDSMMFTMASTAVDNALATWFSQNVMANMAFAGQRNMMMEGMPYVGDSGEMYMNMKMGDMSLLSNHHANLLLDAQNGKWRFHMNAQVLNGLSAEDELEAEAGLRDRQSTFAALYAHYSHSDAIEFKVGKVIPPFGIYNDVYYITPLFATVVLPEMYEAQPNYLRQSLRRNILPKNANFMVSGTIFRNDWEYSYAAYMGNGKDKYRSEESTGGGFRLKAAYDYRINLGFSYYTGEQDDDIITSSIGPLHTFASQGQETIWGIDVETSVMDENLRLQFEYVNSEFDASGSKPRSTYYVRAIWEGWNKFKPFIMYDSFEDEGDELFQKSMNRLGIGGSYRFSDNLYVKAEFHHHYFDDDDGLPDDTDPSRMFRASLIFAF